MLDAMSNQRYVGRRIDSFTFAEGEFYANTEFDDCTFDDTNIQKVTFNECCFVGCTFDNSTLADIMFNDCRLLNCTFNDGNLMDVVFDDCSIDNCEISDMNSIRDVEILKGMVRRCSFKNNRNYYDAVDFEDTLIMSSTFDNYSLNGCDFTRTNVRGCTFVECDLSVLDKIESTFAWCLFKRCDLDKLIIEDTTYILCKFLDCKFGVKIKVRGRVQFLDTKLQGFTTIPPDVSSNIEVGCIILDADKARPPAAPEIPTESHHSSLVQGFRDAYPDPGDYQTYPRKSNTVQRSLLPVYKNKKKAVRFFTDGV